MAADDGRFGGAADSGTGIFGNEAGMKLCYHPVSTAGWAVLLFAAESGIELEPKILELFAGEQNQPAYSAIDPGHQVPVLEDGDFRPT